jgi:K+-transporting ATPase ATPase B chain
MDYYPGAPQAGADLVTLNALIIILLLPLALHGVSYRAVGTSTLMRDNLLIYGLVAPFIGIKLINILLVLPGLV